MSLVDALAGGLLCAAICFAWGAHAAVPWQLRRAAPEARRKWALVAALLLLVGVQALLALVRRFEDSALASGLAPVATGVFGSLAHGLAVAVLGALVADLLLIFAWRQLEDRAWPIVAGIGAVLAGAGSIALGALAAGGAAAFPWASALRAAVLALLAAAAGEAVLAERPKITAVAGLSLPLFVVALPADVRDRFLAAGGLALLGVAAALLFAGRFAVRAGCRRALVAGGILLAAISWAAAAGISAALAAEAGGADVATAAGE